MGAFTIQDIQQMGLELQRAASMTLPKLNQLMATDGAQELMNGVSSALARRFTARAIKFAFGTQEAAGFLLAGGGRKRGEVKSLQQ